MVLKPCEKHSILFASCLDIYLKNVSYLQVPSRSFSNDLFFINLHLEEKDRYSWILKSAAKKHVFFEIYKFYVNNFR